MCKEVQIKLFIEQRLNRLQSIHDFSKSIKQFHKKCTVACDKIQNIVLGVLK